MSRRRTPARPVASRCDSPWTDVILRFSILPDLMGGALGGQAHDWRRTGAVDLGDGRRVMLDPAGPGVYADDLERPLRPAPVNGGRGPALVSNRSPRTFDGGAVIELFELAVETGRRSVGDSLFLKVLNFARCVNGQAAQRAPWGAFTPRT